MYKNFILGICILSAGETFSRESLSKVLYDTQRAIDNFAQAHPQELQKFKEYLSYYKSEGGYQAVTPAPRTLRHALSAESRELFNRIKQSARRFTQSKASMPGATSLSKEGDIYYQILLKYLEKFNHTK